MKEKTIYTVTNSWNDWWTERHTNKKKAIASARELARQGYIRHYVHVYRQRPGEQPERIWSTQI